MCHLVSAQGQEQLVGLDSMEETIARRRHKRGCGCVRFARIGEPQIVLKHRMELRSDVAALGEQMAGPFAATTGLISSSRIEEDHCLSVHRAILGEAEAEHIDPSAPTQFGRRTVLMCQRVGETSAVHVKSQPLCPTECADILELGACVDAAIFGSVGQGDRERPRVMHPFPEGIDAGPQRGRVELTA